MRTDCGLPSIDQGRAAEFLAARLRAARITVFYAAPGSATFRFLSFDLMPRLARRSRDRCLMRLEADAGSGPPPAGDERRNFDPPGGAAPAEIVVRVQDWSGPALACLQSAVRRSFIRAGAWVTAVATPAAGRFAWWSSLLDARFLVICEHFDHFLQAGADAGAADADFAAFVALWLRILREPHLPVNVLFCVSEESGERMQDFLDRIGATPGSGVYLNEPAADTSVA